MGPFPRPVRRLVVTGEMGRDREQLEIVGLAGLGEQGERVVPAPGGERGPTRFEGAGDQTRWSAPSPTRIRLTDRRASQWDRLAKCGGRSASTDVSNHSRLR